MSAPMLRLIAMPNVLLHDSFLERGQAMTENVRKSGDLPPSRLSSPLAGVNELEVGVEFDNGAQDRNLN